MLYLLLCSPVDPKICGYINFGAYHKFTKMNFLSLKFFSDTVANTYCTYAHTSGRFRGWLGGCSPLLKSQEVQKNECIDIRTQ